MNYAFWRSSAACAVLASVAVLVTGCPGNSNKGGGGGAATGGGSTGDETATFSLAWSEYPSWSVFGAAEDMGLIDGAAGAMGEFETKHGIDIELKELDYEPCLTAYAAGEVDAVCITNIDILSPALQRDSVAIMPISAVTTTMADTARRAVSATPTMLHNSCRAT
ncbi:MAG: hypothetical protein AAFP69_09220, partial [Planctomycetota bacterium]